MLCTGQCPLLVFRQHKISKIRVVYAMVVAEVTGIISQGIRDETVRIQNIELW